MSDTYLSRGPCDRCGATVHYFEDSANLCELVILLRTGRPGLVGFLPEGRHVQAREGCPGSPSRQAAIAEPGSPYAQAWEILQEAHKEWAAKTEPDEMPWELVTRMVKRRGLAHVDPDDEEEAER